MESSKRFVLVDAYAIIFRAYYAFIRNPMVNSEGFNTSTVFGFVNALEDIILKENPTHIGVAFDPPGGNFRNQIYPQYKANRDATPEEIIKSVPVIKDILRAYQIPIVEIPGFEADDVIGTLAKKAASVGMDVYMFTPDKDYLQLLEDRIFIIKPAKGGNDAVLVTRENLRQFYEVDSPEQFLDFLALMGDSADNVPGAPGVGEKTAAKLLAEYTTLEMLLEKSDELKGKLKESIGNNKENILLSKKLVTIVTDVPVEVSDFDFTVKKPDWNSLKEILQRMNFKTLEKRIFSRISTPVVTQQTLFGLELAPSVEPVSSFKTISDTNHNYSIIYNINLLEDLINQLLLLKEFCFDTETTSVNPIDAELVGLSFSWKANEAFYIPFPKIKADCDAYVSLLKKVFENPSIIKVGQNIKFDMLVLKNYGIKVKGVLFDTMLAHYLLEPEQKHNMDYLSEKYLKYTPVHIEELIGPKGKSQLNMASVALEKISEYAAEDADVTWQLKSILEQELEKKELSSLASTIEMPLVSVLAEMEYCGVSLDIKTLHDYANVIREELIKLEEQIYSHAGIHFNIQSPKQLGEILFEKLKIDPNAKKTKSQQYATGEEILAELTDKHPIVNLILDYRTYRKLLNTYVEALPEIVNKRTGRIHTSFNQAIAATGRLSSVDPNLQNIPIRDERGREIRKAFIPGGEDRIILSADYSQIELRIMAHISEDANMIEAFANNMDIHTATASKIYGVSPEEVTREMRSKAKTANFGIIYGISAFGLSQRLKIPRSEASQLIQGYFNTFPGVKTYMDKAIESARAVGYVKTLFGRRRYLPDIFSANHTVKGMAERNAINSPIQGTAADIIKIAMIRIQNEFEKQNLKSNMILQVHDELVFDVLKSELDTVKHIVKENMENAVALKVPMVVEMGEGANWLEAH